MWIGRSNADRQPTVADAHITVATDARRMVAAYGLNLSGYWLFSAGTAGETVGPGP